jgi:hypothetical protein
MFIEIYLFSIVLLSSLIINLNLEEEYNDYNQIIQCICFIIQLILLLITLILFYYSFTRIGIV